MHGLKHATFENSSFSRGKFLSLFLVIHCILIISELLVFSSIAFAIFIFDYKV